MAITTVPSEQLERAQASYARCQQSPEFFRAFYDRFLASDPSIPPYFATTRFEKQDKLLQHGIAMLLIHARRANPNLLSRLVERHGPGDLNIPTRLYPVFVDSLLATVREFDAACDGATEEAWRAALAPGIALMTGSRA
jgi:hemoglobin-like flavoprotein